MRKHCSTEVTISLSFSLSVLGLQVHMTDKRMRLENVFFFFLDKEVKQDSRAMHLKCFAIILIFPRKKNKNAIHDQPPDWLYAMLLHSVLRLEN